MTETKENTDKILTVCITEPTSLINLVKQRGTGPSGFYGGGDSVLPDHKSVKEIILPGTYTVDFEKEMEKETLEWRVPHITVLAAAYFKHLDETGERILNDDWYKTSQPLYSDFYDENCLILSSDSDGLHVNFSFVVGSARVVPVRKIA